MSPSAAWSRRAVLAGAVCSCALPGCALAADTRIRPAAMTALAPRGFRPTDRDERGLWQACDRFEEELSASTLLLQAPALQRYAKEVVDRLMVDRPAETRVYVVHDPDFNAAMAPNGMMLVNTGFLVRARNEAQFAAVLGHECGHYLRRHSVQGWRDEKATTGVMAFLQAGAQVGAGIAVRTGGDGRSWIDMATRINTSLALSMMRYTREQERESDAYGVALMDRAGYPPEAAAMVWKQLIEERRASARSRRKKYRDHSASAWSTHPASASRLADLDASSKELRMARPARRDDDGKARWDAAVAPLRAALLDEQVRLNDPGTSLYLVQAMAADGWNGLLRYNEGEIYRLRDEEGDAARAAAAFAAAIDHADAPPEAWRAHGYALLKQGQGAEGKAALSRYLAARPLAPDVSIIRFTLAQ